MKPVFCIYKKVVVLYSVAAVLLSQGVLAQQVDDGVLSKALPIDVPPPIEAKVPEGLALPGSIVSLQGENTESDQTKSSFDESVQSKVRSQDTVKNIPSSAKTIMLQKEGSLPAGSVSNSYTKKERNIFEQNWQSAHQENPQGQFNVGKMMYIGQGVKKDTAQALLWMEKAGKQDFLPAIKELSTIYFEGKHYKNAKYWIEKQVAKGDSEAMVKMAEIYTEGLGVPKDDRKALRYMRDAADKSHVAAQLNLFVRYVNGWGVAKDPAEAYKWGKLAGRLVPEISKGLEDYKKQLTPEQIAEGERRATAWKPAL